nr:hypothetical protein Iba_chr05dCG14490 [Ipomoea batatas]
MLVNSSRFFVSAVGLGTGRQAFDLGDNRLASLEKGMKCPNAKRMEIMDMLEAFEFIEALPLGAETQLGDTKNLMVHLTLACDGLQDQMKALMAMASQRFRASSNNIKHLYLLLVALAKRET